MIQWILVFLLIPLLAPMLGLYTIAGVSLTIVKILFVVFLVVFILSLLGGGWGRIGPDGRRSWW